MNIKFTRLMFVFVGFTISCLQTTAGQIRIASDDIAISKQTVFNKEIKLRTDNSVWWPDSVVDYTSEGKKITKAVYDQNDKICSVYSWENGNWELYFEPSETGGLSFYAGNVSVTKSDQLYFHVPSVANREWYYYYESHKDDEYNLEYDENENLILVEIKKGFYDGTDNATSYHIKYNKNNNPISIEEWNYTWIIRKWNFEYNQDGNRTLCERYWYRDNVKLILDNDMKETAEFDEQGRPTSIKRYRGNTSLNKWLLNEYTLYYYSDNNNTNVEIDNNNPVDNNNQGGFDIDVNIPTDSISNGSITIILPDGFTLDEENTTLTLDFAGLFDLKITKQENNSWLFEISPKSTKSALLSSESAAKMLHVAYKVDEELKKGTYDISINNILFETKGGNFIPEPAITVPVNVNRWGVNNEFVENEEATVYVRDNALYVQSAQTETVAVYAPSGVKLYEAKIPSGMMTINAANFPKGVLFVKGSSGWVQKVVLH